ncbi:Protein of unknown function [Cotesia congregata]|uniref:Uncharacterized protein n=1 Tax=Cotesia congregata TaxID=51543 RepID=A0A8J2HRW5_COTCN|nr:Protein of unknown function [Cotesia congregata]
MQLCVRFITTVLSSRTLKLLLRERDDLKVRSGLTGNVPVLLTTAIFGDEGDIDDIGANDCVGDGDDDDEDFM